MQVLALVAFIVAVTMTVSCLHAALMPYASVHASLCTVHVHTYITVYTYVRTSTTTCSHWLSEGAYSIGTPFICLG